MGGKEFVLRPNCLDTLITRVVNQSDRGINAAYTAEFFEKSVGLLIGYGWKCAIVGEVGLGIFGEDGPRVGVQLNPEAVGGLFSYYLYVVVVYVGFSEACRIGITQPGVATKQEYITLCVEIFL